MAPRQPLASGSSPKSSSREIDETPDSIRGSATMLPA